MSYFLILSVREWDYQVEDTAETIEEARSKARDFVRHHLHQVVVVEKHLTVKPDFSSVGTIEEVPDGQRSEEA